MKVTVLYGDEGISQAEAVKLGDEIAQLLRVAREDGSVDAFEIVVKAEDDSWGDQEEA